MASFFHGLGLSSVNSSSRGQGLTGEVAAELMTGIWDWYLGGCILAVPACAYRPDLWSS